MAWTLLILGLALWSGAHWFKRLAPKARAGLGDAGKGLVALLILASLALMIFGYQGAEGPTLWDRHPATVGINNLLMVLATYLLIASQVRSKLAQVMRHPMLIAVKTWCLAHLLVNGDLASIVLFGGLLVWAVVSVILINKQSPWQKSQAPISPAKEAIAIAITLVAFGGITWLHYWLGHPAFG